MAFEKELIRVEGVCKTFPGVKALNGVRLQVFEGEVHGLVGENGAGKSTLIKVLTGAHQMDPGGTIYLHGNQISINNPIEAKNLKIGAVYQDVMMVPHLSVGENFFLGKLPKKGGLVDWKTVYEITGKTLDGLGINVDPRVKVKDLTVAMQEMVTIARVVHEDTKLIIFDEPTALLATSEVELLFKIIEDLKQKGCGIIYISHRLEEIFRICDTVTVLKDGTYIDTMSVSETNENDIITKMVGRSIEDMYYIERTEHKEVALEAKSLTKKGVFEDISFNVRRGEILGLYGLVGAGRTEILRCLTGADKMDSGEVYVHGKKTTIKKPANSIKSGIGFLPEDRKRQGLGMNLSVSINTNIASYDKISKLGIINLNKEIERAEHYKNEIRTKTPSIKQLVKNLSGGNQQKVVLSRWLACDSDILIFDEPTVGVDVGAKGEIYAIFESLLKKGAAIIIVSSYLPEVMGLSDRIVVIHEGKIAAEINRDEFLTDGKMNEEIFVRYASGL